MQQDIINIRSEISNIEGKLKLISEVNHIEYQKHQLETNLSNIIKQLKYDFQVRDNQIINSIRNHFNYIISETLGDEGIISIPINKQNNIEFIAEIVDFSTNKMSSKDKGTTYKKLYVVPLILQF